MNNVSPAQTTRIQSINNWVVHSDYKGCWEFSTVTPGPVVAGLSAVSTVSEGDQLQVPVQWQGPVVVTYIVVETRPASRDRASCVYTGSCRGPGCWCVLLWLQDLTLGMCPTVGANDTSQAGSTQVAPSYKQT